MKINLLTVGALAVALAAPVGASAQQAQAGQQPGASTRHHHTTPSAAKIQHRWMKRFGHMNLSGDQQQRIQSMVEQYSQGHPAGSPIDRNASKELHRQIMGVLSSDQQNQYQQERQARRAQMQQRHGQSQGQGQGANYQGQEPQQQYQGQPNGGQYPQQQFQGQPNQGPPGQGPPPDQGPPQGQGPPDQQPPA
jgi:Spy/CpxP family protein refolding chaperone